MAKRSSMRASDADRERVAERLRVAAGEGRLLAHELEERLTRTFRALTYGDLDAVVVDLPDPGVAGAGAAAFGMAGAAPQRRHRVTGWGLVRRYPLPSGIVAVIVAISVTAMVASIVALAVSGLWIVPLVLFFVLRGRGWVRPQRRRRYGYQYRSSRSW